MSLKLFLFLAPVAVGGYVVATRHEAGPAGGNEAAAIQQASATAAAAHPVTGPRKSHAECVALEQQLLLANAPGDRNPMAAISALSGVERELRRQGCDTMNGYGEGTSFRTPSNRMGAAPAPAMGPAPAGAPRADGASFEPGRPMVDVSAGRDSR